MKFIDEIKLKVSAGKGGDGMVAFRREAHVDRGGPSGGDGGDGGNIYFCGDSGMNTLLPLHYRKIIKGHDGTNGARKNLFGAKGKDLYVYVPLGTLVYEENILVADIIDTQPYLIAKGGRGGHGNAHFKTQRNRAPRLFEKGLSGETKFLKLELKVIADIGLVGFPNVGKSTLINALSNAKAKVADYPFTTLVPQLGLVKVFANSFVVADLPGLIELASEGKGLGVQFLKHIERCKVIAYLLDFSLEQKDPVATFEALKKELSNYKKALLAKAFLVIANKSDESIIFAKNWKRFCQVYPHLDLIAISALKRTNLERLKELLWNLQQKAPQALVKAPAKKDLLITYKADFEIHKENDYYLILGPKIDYWTERIPLVTFDNLFRFNQILKRLGVWDQLLKLGIKSGDLIKINDYQFSWGSLQF